MEHNKSVRVGKLKSNPRGFERVRAKRVPESKRKIDVDIQREIDSMKQEIRELRDTVNMLLDIMNEEEEFSLEQEPEWNKKYGRFRIGM